MTLMSQFHLMNQKHTAQPVWLDSLTNDSRELVQFSESIPYSTTSVVRFTNKCLL